MRVKWLRTTRRFPCSQARTVTGDDDGDDDDDDDDDEVITARPFVPGSIKRPQRVESFPDAGES